MLSRPTIFITPREVHNTHKLLIGNVNTVAPDAEDPLRVVLGELGDLPDEEAVLGDPDHADGEMSLALANRFEVPADGGTSLKALLVRTKRNVIDVIRFQVIDDSSNPDLSNHVIL
jgi:Ras GTPase-activating-like protein IQGAP2/3